MKVPATFQRRRARIEIIPLIDIIFFLLATFMMVSMSMVKNLSIQVQLPSAATGAPEERKSVVTISITEGGDIYLNKEKIPMDVLKERLKELKDADPELTVFINGDERADFGKAVAVFDQVRLLGITKVSVQIKSQSS